MTTKTKVNKKREIASYMQSKGLPYEMEYTGNVYHAIASAGSQAVVMAHTYHEDADENHNAQYFVGYYGDRAAAEEVRQGILNAKPRKRFVQSVVIVNGSN